MTLEEMAVEEGLLEMVHKYTGRTVDYFSKRLWQAVLEKAGFCTVENVQKVVDGLLEQIDNWIPAFDLGSRVRVRGKREYLISEQLSVCLERTASGEYIAMFTDEVDYWEEWKSDRRFNTVW